MTRLPSSLSLAVLLAAALLLKRTTADGAIVTYRGMCDASAAMALDGELFAVADDEDNVIRVYSRTHGGLPVHTTNLSSFLKIGKRGGEVDLEGAARIGGRIYWISSHGADAKGKVQPSRRQLFATTGAVTNGAIDLHPVGRPYGNLLEDLARDPRFKEFGLAAAALRAPKTPGALNIEGLAATPEGHLLIGFRNPIPRGQALIIPLLNPDRIILGESARFGDPLLLDLGGLGIRSIDGGDGRYLIIAGSFDGSGSSHLYEWSGGREAPRRIDRPELAGLNPEAITVFDSADANLHWVLSDDGTVKVAGIESKRLKDPNQKRYRAIGLNL